MAKNSHQRLQPQLTCFFHCTILSAQESNRSGINTVSLTSKYILSHFNPMDNPVV